MEPADSIRRLGFARWYERRLIECHAWLISGFMCMVAVAASMEELSVLGSTTRLLAYVIVIGATATIGIYSLVRYLRMLSEKEKIGEHATCRAYGSTPVSSLLPLRRFDAAGMTTSGA